MGSESARRVAGEYLGIVASRSRYAQIPSAHRPSIPFAEFRQVVRRYRPSALLPALGSVATLVQDPELPAGATAMMHAAPWAIATASRESILWGNEHRRPDVGAEDLRIIFNAFSDIYASRTPHDRSVLSIMTRHAYEQFPYQESVFAEVSRSHVLLGEGPAHVSTEVICEESLGALLGAPLGQAVGATFFLHVLATRDNGWFDPGSLTDHGLREIFDLWPESVVRMRLEELSSTPEQFKADYESKPKPPRGYERWAYNPLVAKPFIRWPDGRFLAPQPALILRTVSPSGLYYAGMTAFGDAFAHDLGYLTEWYVGEQLRSISGAEVHGEVTYGRDNLKSVDWFLVLPTVVILFEVKSTRYNALEKAAVEGSDRRVLALLNKARKQLRRTNERLDGRDAAFGHIPSDRRRVNIIVTAEPYYMANSDGMRDLLDDVAIPTLTASLSELEALVCLSADAIAEQMTAIADDPERSTWTLGSALRESIRGVRNPILQRAFDSYPWPEEGTGR